MASLQSWYVRSAPSSQTVNADCYWIHRVNSLAALIYETRHQRLCDKGQRHHSTIPCTLTVSSSSLARWLARELARTRFVTQILVGVAIGSHSYPFLSVLYTRRRLPRLLTNPSSHPCSSDLRFLLVVHHILCLICLPFLPLSIVSKHLSSNVGRASWFQYYALG